jgi:hypothetical protein
VLLKGDLVAVDVMVHCECKIRIRFYSKILTLTWFDTTCSTYVMHVDIPLTRASVHSDVLILPVIKSVCGQSSDRHGGEAEHVLRFCLISIGPALYISTLHLMIMVTPDLQKL